MKYDIKYIFIWFDIKTIVIINISNNSFFLLISFGLILITVIVMTTGNYSSDSDNKNDSFYFITILIKFYEMCWKLIQKMELKKLIGYWVIKLESLDKFMGKI